MKTFEFDSQIQKIDEMNQFSDEQIKNEPMLFNCDYKHAYDLGGPITGEFLDRIADFLPTEEIVVDSRVHMLMPGWFPCIPGFHRDDVPRSGRDGQPNYFNPEYKSKHIMALINADVCPTEFAVGRVELPDIEEGIYYKEWHKHVALEVACGNLQSVKLRGNPIIAFDWQSFHQGTRAVKGGWRWFIRVSYNTDRVKNCTNEIRRQVQVYLEHPMEGW